MLRKWLVSLSLAGMLTVGATGAVMAAGGPPAGAGTGTCTCQYDTDGDGVCDNVPPQDGTGNQHKHGR